MTSYFDNVIQSIQHQRWHGQCDNASLQTFRSVGYHSCLLRTDSKVTDAVKLCALKNLRSVDERLTEEEIALWEGSHPAGVLHIGRTPVMTAIWVNAMDALHVLRTSGASFTLRCSEDDNFTALHYAILLQRTEMIRYMLPLLPRSQLLSRTRKDGDTPLHLAARCGHYDLVGILMAHAAKLHRDDTFVWRQLHSTPPCTEGLPPQQQQDSNDAATAPPPSSLICQLMLSQTTSGGCTAAHLIAQCRTAQWVSDSPSPPTLGADDDALFVTPTPCDALHCLLQCADAHDSLFPLLATTRTWSGECLLAASESPPLWCLVKSFCDRCGLAVCWAPSPLPNPRSLLGDEEDEDLALQSLLAMRVKRRSVEVGDARSPAAPVVAELPVLTSSGESPLHRLALKANLPGGDGMVRVWLHCLVDVFPPSPSSSPTRLELDSGAASEWSHHVRDDVYTKVLEFASPRTGKSAWSTVVELHGANSDTAREMMSVALELDTQHEAAASAVVDETTTCDEYLPPPALFIRQAVGGGAAASPSNTSGRLPPLPTSDDMCLTVVAATPIQALQSYKLLTVFDHALSSRRLTHHLAYHGDSDALEWLQDAVIAELCRVIRVRALAASASSASAAAAAASTAAAALKCGVTSHGSSAAGRPTSSGSMRGAPQTPLLAGKHQRSSPSPTGSPQGAGIDASPTTPLERPRSRQQSVEDHHDNQNASFHSTGSGDTNISQLRDVMGADNENDVHQSVLTTLNGVLQQLSILYAQTLLAVDHDGFQPLFLAALRDHSDAVHIICRLSDRIAVHAVLVMVLMAQVVARMTKSRRGAAAAAQAEAEAAAMSKSMRRSSNLKRTTSNTASLQRVGSSPGLGGGAADFDAGAAASQSSLALSLSTALPSERTSMLAQDVRDALQPMIPKIFSEVLFEAVLSQLNLNFTRAVDEEERIFKVAQQQQRERHEAESLNGDVSPPQPTLSRTVPGAAVTSAASSGGAPTPTTVSTTEDQQSPAQRRTIIDSMEWDALMHVESMVDDAAVYSYILPSREDSRGGPPTSLFGALRGASVVQTIGVLLQARHPIRVETTAFHQAVEAGSYSSARALLQCALSRWRIEADRVASPHLTEPPETGSTHLGHSSREDTTSISSLERCKGTVKTFLSQCGSDGNKHRNALHIAVCRGDIRTIHGIFSVLTDALVVPSAMQEGGEGGYASQLRDVALSLTSSWGGFSGAFIETPSVADDALRHCLLFRGPQGTQPVAPLTMMESSLYVPHEDDEKAKLSTQCSAALDFFTPCCDGCGRPPEEQTVPPSSHGHPRRGTNDPVRCRCWLMMDAIKQFFSSPELRGHTVGTGSAHQL